MGEITNGGSLLITGGTVVDGTGRPGVAADVRVKDGRIVEVGPRLSPTGEQVIDASGCIVAPGFIESHAHVDPQLFWDPFCDPVPQHGVTTVLAGNCSLSLFPVNESMGSAATELFALIEDMPLGAMRDHIPWTWTHYEGYRDVLAEQGLGVNIATMVGHTLLRWFVMGDAAWERAASADEVARMCEVLDLSIRQGAFGLSTSFTDKDQHGRYVPPVHATDDEFTALIEVLARHDAILEFVPNLSGGTAEEDIERIARITKPFGVVSTWNTVADSKRAPERAGRFLAQATRLQADGVKMFPQGTPRTFDLRISWERSVLFTDMPNSWNKVIQARGDDKVALLRSADWRETARAEWDAAKLSPFPTWDIGRLRLLTVTRPENEVWMGKTLADLVAARGTHPSDTMADWILENDLDPGVIAVGVTNDNPEKVGEILAHPATIVGASDVGAHVAMFCAAGDSTLLLTRHVRERGDLTIEQAIWKLTGQLADNFRFADRGVVAPGKIADLVVFCLDELHWDQDVVVYDLPENGMRLRRPEGGYRHTILSGHIVQSGGTLTGARPGRPIGLPSVGS